MSLNILSAACVELQNRRPWESPGRAVQRAARPDDAQRPGFRATLTLGRCLSVGFEASVVSESSHVFAAVRCCLQPESANPKEGLRESESVSSAEGGDDAICIIFDYKSA